MSRRHIRAVISGIAITAAAALFIRAGTGEWEKISRASVSFHPGWLSLSFVLNLVCFLLDTVSVQYAYRAVARHPGELTLGRSIAIYNVSSLLKYLPGRLWALVSQVERATRSGLEGKALFEANIACTIIVTCSGLLTGAVFLLTYGSHTENGFFPVLSLAPTALACVGLLAYRFSSRPLRALIRLAGRPDLVNWQLPSDKRLCVLFILYVANWSLAGLGGVTAWLAFGHPGSVGDMVLVGSSMGAGWTLALLAFVVPGGLGVREGAIFWMLDGAVGRQVAVVLPILTRLIYMACEGILGLVGMILARELKMISPASRRLGD